MNGRLWSTQAFVASRKQWVRLVYLTIITTLQGLLNISKCGLNPHLPSLCTHALPLLLDLAPVMWFCEMTGSTFSHTVNLIHTLQYITVGIYKCQNIEGSEAKTYKAAVLWMITSMFSRFESQISDSLVWPLHRQTLQSGVRADQVFTQLILSGRGSSPHTKI